MGVEAAVEQNSGQDKTALQSDETMRFEGVRVSDPTRDFAVIAGIDMTALDQIFNECASGALAAGGRNRTDPNRGRRRREPARFRCRADEQRHVAQPIFRAR